MNIMKQNKIFIQNKLRYKISPDLFFILIWLQMVKYCNSIWHRICLIYFMRETIMIFFILSFLIQSCKAQSTKSVPTVLTGASQINEY